MTPEGKIQAHLFMRVKQSGGQYRRLQWIGRNGAPDALIWWPGMIVFVEVKSELGRLTAMQAQEQKKMRDTGLDVRVVHCIEEVNRLIDDLRGC